MDDLNRYIKPELIVEDLKIQTKEQAISALVERIFQVGADDCLKNLPRRKLYEEVMNRENIHTTATGNGLAFPHASIEQCLDLIICIGISREGIDFKSPDSKSCNIICLMISPVYKPYIILQSMGIFERIFADKKTLDKILSGLTAQQITEAIKNTANAIPKIITAREVMRTNIKPVNLDTTIEETAQIMHLKQADILPVVNANNMFCGEISCLKIFAYGIPDFFNQLATVSFVKHLDPFEKYFKLRKELKVRDLYDGTAKVITTDTTLLEIIFEMTAKNRSSLFVVDNGNLVGEVDRFSIIDRILFF